MAPGAGDRLTSAQVLRSLLEKLHTTSGNVAVIDTVAGVTLPVAAETAGQIRNDAARDTQALRSFKWKLVEKLKQGVERGDASGDSARAIEKSIHEAISIPGRSLSDELASAENKLVGWVVDEDSGATPLPPRQPTVEGDATLNTADDIPSLLAELKDAIAEHRKQVHVHWWVE